MKDAIRNNGLILGIFALITAALLAGTYQGTKERIAQSQREVAQRALLEVVPDDLHDNEMLSDTLEIPGRYLVTLGIDQDQPVHVARMNGQPVAFIVPGVAPDGYNGDISLIVGIKVDGTITGVRSIAHGETPGLGDKVDVAKSDWILGFNGRSLRNPTAESWAVKKDGGEFDQFTGATITPRAVVNQVLAVLHYFDEDQQRLISAAEKTIDTNPTQQGDSQTE